MKRFALRCSAEIAVVILTISIVTGGVLAYRRLPSAAGFTEYSQIVQCVLLALGLLSIILLLLQIRQTASWNRVLSYHEYFGELPSQEKVAALYECLHRLGLHRPSSGKPLSADQASKIWLDEGVKSDTGRITQVGEQVVRDYLNDFEEFCGAINAGVVSETYARELEGSRTINAYFGFEEVIKLIQDEEVKHRQSEAEQRSEGAQRFLEIHRKPYHELRKVAVVWKRRREAEYQRLLKKRVRSRERQEDEENEDGVPREA